MPRMDPFGNFCDRWIRVHIRQVHETRTNVFQAISNAQRLYGKCGIYFDVASMMSASLDAADLRRLSVVNGDCRWNHDSAEQSELFTRVGATSVFGINAVFVDDIQTPTGALNGCAGHAPQRGAVLIGAACTPWTLAHEIGHVLLGPTFSPVHTASPGNIMFARSAQFTQMSKPSFDAVQIAQIRRSSYVTAC